MQECKLSGRTFIWGRPCLEIVRFVHGQCLSQSAIIVAKQRLQTECMNTLPQIIRQTDKFAKRMPIRQATCQNCAADTRASSHLQKGELHMEMREVDSEIHKWRRRPNLVNG